MNKRENWIDILRGIAVIAVIIDHAFVFFPTFRITLLGVHTYFSVNWFIFLSGVTNTISRKNKKLSYREFLLKKISILGIYFCSAVIYFLILFFPGYNSSTFLEGLVNFSTAAHFYFVLVILQLYLMFPFLYGILYKKKLIVQLIILSVISLFTMKMFPLSKPPWQATDFPSFIGWSYLLTFTLGIFYQLHFDSGIFKKNITYFSFAVFLILEVYLLISNHIFVIAIPNLKLIAWSLSLLFVAKFLIEKFLNRSLPVPILPVLGRNSLFIYLFHFIVLKLFAGFSPNPHPAVFFFAIFLSILIPLILQTLYAKTLSLLPYPPVPLSRQKPLYP